MRVTTEPMENRELAVTVEVDPEMVRDEMRKAAQRLAGRGRIPGYRKGKAPYQAVLRHYGADAVFEEMLDDLVQSSYRRALDEAKIVPYAPGRLVDVQKEPLRLQMAVPLPPTVELGDYREIRKEFPEIEVTDEQVDEALDKIRREQAAWQPVERPAQEEDMVSVTYTGEVDGKVVFNEDEDFPLLIGKPYGEPLPGFAARLAGLKAGDPFDFTLDFPEDDPRKEFAGKTCHFKGEVQTVRALDLPPLDDDLAKMVGDYENLEALRRQVREALEEERKRETHQEFAEQVLTALVEQAAIEYPPIMVEEELDSMMEDMERQLKRQDQDLDAYLSLSGQTREEFRESLKPRAERNLQRSLVLSQFLDREKIEVTPEEFDAEYSRLVGVYTNAGVPAELLQQQSFQRRVYADIRMQKGMDRLVEIAKGEAPPLHEETEPAEEAAEEAAAAPAEEE